MVQGGLKHSGVRRRLRDARGFGFPASPLASTSTVSLVLMSPSTVMRLKLLRHRFLERGLQYLASTAASVVRNRAWWRAAATRGGPRAGRAHAGLNHARAFADAAEADGPAAQLELHRDLLGPRVAGHDGFGGVVARAPGRAQSTRGIENARLTLSIGRVTPMRPVEPTRTCSAGMCSVLFGKRRHCQRVLHALSAGAGVGVAGIDHDRLRGAFLHARHANFHRRGADLVGREHARHGRRRFGNDQRQVAFLALVRAFAGAEPFDVAKHAAGQKAVRRDDGAGDFIGFLFMSQKSRV